MGQLLNFNAKSEIERAGGKTPGEVKDRTLNEYVNEMMRVKTEVTRLIDSSGLIRLNELELLVTLKNLIRNELIDRGEISESLLPCCDYLGITIHKYIMGNVSINQYTQDFITQDKADYKCAGDVNLIKYVFQYNKKRHNPMTGNDYMLLASTMYYNAYEKGQMQLGYLLAYNLQKLDSIIGLPGITGRLFAVPISFNP